MNDTVDLLQIKIEKAKAQLSEDTLNAIAAVDWMAAILKMRETKGYSFEQLGDLEIETELLLCGLLKPENYPKELEKRMKISRAQANELVEEMNKSVFSKIKEELIKNTERKKIFEGNKKNDTQILDKADIKIIEPLPAIDTEKEKPTESKEDILKKIEKTELPQKPKIGELPIFAQKLSSSVQIPSVKTEHFLENITKSANTDGSNQPSTKAKIPGMDPYREIPE